MRYDHRKALVLGAGRSGVAAARLLLRQGGRVTLVDSRWDEAQRVALEAEGVRCETLSDTTAPQGDYDLVVTSPSIPLEHCWITTAQAQGLELISELELGSVYWRGEAIALTGSKGKSSAVKCLTDTLNRAGRPAVTAGNYGTPLCARVLESPTQGEGTIAVVEVSSFQLEHTKTFAPRLAAILNIQADHLDRHGSLAAYAALKYRLFAAQNPAVACAYLHEGLLPLAPDNPLPCATFGTTSRATWRYQMAEPGRGVVEHEGICVPVVGYFANAILGPAAALIVAMLSELGLSPTQIAEGFASFVPLAHRMQQVATHAGVTFIDDSKATSLAATAAALTIVGNRVRLIAGGRLKEDNLTFVGETLARCAVKVYLIGEAQEPLAAAWAPFVPCSCCTTMAEAVRQARAEASAGDTVLLSPGCASFDQYPGMAARGADFQACVAAVEA